jgi:hypothetical protein
MRVLTPILFHELIVTINIIIGAGLLLFTHYSFPWSVDEFIRKRVDTK